MEWEWGIKFRIGRLALLRRKDFAMTPTTKRWGIGWNGKYVGMDGGTYFSWSCWRELK